MEQRAQSGLLDRASPPRIPEPADAGSPEPHQPISEAPGNPISGGELCAIAGLAVVTVIVARLLAPALPGSAAGISTWIARTDVLAGFLSQLTVVFGVLVGFRLIVATLRVRVLGLLHRVLVAPAGAIVLTLIMAATERPLAPTLLLTLAVLSSLVALGAAPAAVKKPSTRALGFAIGAAGLSAFVHVLSRVLAMRASSEALASLFRTAQGLATLGALLSLASAAVVFVWVWARRRRPGAVALFAVTALALLGGWGAMRGSAVGAPLWQVLASRGMSVLGRNPQPFLPVFIQHAAELWVILTAGAVLVAPGSFSAVQAGFALALLGQSSADVPAAALFLLLAGLTAPMAAGREARTTAVAAERSNGPEAELGQGKD